MTFEGPKDGDLEDSDENEEDDEHYLGEEWKGGDYDPDDDKRWKDESETTDSKDKNKEPPKHPTGPTENIRRKFGQSDADAEKIASESDKLKKPIRVLISEKIAELESELETIDEMIEDGVSTPENLERKGVILKKLSDLRSNSM